MNRIAKTFFGLPQLAMVVLLANASACSILDGIYGTPDDAGQPEPVDAGMMIAMPDGGDTFLDAEPNPDASDAGHADASDAGQTDATTMDAAQADASAMDGGFFMDAEQVDAMNGTTDAEQVDAMTTDGGFFMDAEQVDAMTMDAGFLMDAGQSDAEVPPQWPDIIDIATGHSHTCALRADRTVVCWGSNETGQLAPARPFGTILSSGKPVPVDLSDVVEIVGGGEHTCARTQNRDVYCWGYNDSGQLANNMSIQRRVPTKVFISDVVEITAGNDHTCARLSSGSIKCWGNNSNGQLGDGSNTSQSTPTDINSSDTYSSISAGGYHTCAITVAGDAQCWGGNGAGELGNGSTINQPTPASVYNLSNVEQISAGINHTCARTGNDNVYCWGRNGYGQLGLGNTTTSTIPIHVSNLGPAEEIEAGGFHTCARLNSGEVKCWGNNSYGQLGDGSLTYHSSPSNSVMFNNPSNAVTQLSAGRYHTCALRTNGEIECWGENHLGQCGDGANIIETNPSEVTIGPFQIDEIRAASQHSCARSSGGGLYCWGANGYGQFGNGTLEGSSSPINNPNFPSHLDWVATGSEHTCAITRSGVDAHCWGNGGAGQLGNQANSSERSPTYVASRSMTSANLQGVGVGAYHSCVIDADVVWCWGANDFGQLGDGTITSTNVPVRVLGITESVAQIAVGRNHTCALTSSTSTPTVMCWGQNDLYQVGNSMVSSTSTPMPVNGLMNPVEISSFADHTCARLSTGAVQCWGNNEIGQLGNGTANNFNVVVTALNVINAETIAVGGDHTCIIDTNKDVYCWGSNFYGQLGDGTTTSQYTVTSTRIGIGMSAFNNIAHISAGQRHTCAINMTGDKAWCWGTNEQGQIGTGRALYFLRPNAVVAP